MVESRTRSLILLARIQAALGGLLTAIVVVVYSLYPDLLVGASTSLAIALLGSAGLIYFATLHQVIGRRRLALSTLILTIITTLNLILVIATTGGLDSPYYSLWLLAIVVAGIFGGLETGVILGVTLAYYGYELLLRGGLRSPKLRDYLIQLVITLLAAALAEWVHAKSRRVATQTNKIASLSGKLTEEQLKAQALMSSIGEGVMVVDMSRRILLFNKAAQQLTGWDEASAQNIDYSLVLQLHTAKDEDLTEATEPFTNAWTKNESLVRDDLVMTSRSGRKVQLSLSVSPIADGDGNLTGAIALFRDISKEKEVERQKDEFVSTASHEMRTPVAAIEGYIALAMNPNVATVDDRAKKYLDKAHEAIGHLGELFRDLLSVAKAEEGGLNGKIEPVNIAELLRAAVEDMQFAAQKKNLTLALQTASSVGKALTPIYYVAANPERLREVVMNLIDNAVKYTPEGGIKVSLSGDAKEVKVAVSDTGGGIPAEDVPHLFQKFYRVDNTDTRTIGGTGLGLYLCRRVIELINGRIWVESKVGFGSSFIFSLPRLSEEAVQQMKAAAANPTTATAATPGGVVQPTPAGSAGPALAQPIAMPIPSHNSNSRTLPQGVH